MTGPSLESSGSRPPFAPQVVFYAYSERQQLSPETPPEEAFEAFQVAHWLTVELLKQRDIATDSPASIGSSAGSMYVELFRQLLDINPDNDAGIDYLGELAGEKVENFLSYRDPEGSMELFLDVARLAELPNAQQITTTRQRIDVVSSLDAFNIITDKLVHKLVASGQSLPAEMTVVSMSGSYLKCAALLTGQSADSDDLVRQKARDFISEIETEFRRGEQ